MLTTQDLILIEARVTNEGPNVTLAYGLWFVLGFLSGHRFYLGRPISAICQIVLFVVLIGFVWLLVDAFLIPGMVRAKQAEIRDRLVAQALAGQ